MFKSDDVFVVIGTILRLYCSFGACFFFLVTVICFVHLPAYFHQLYSNMEGLSSSILLTVIMIINK